MYGKDNKSHEAKAAIIPADSSIVDTTVLRTDDLDATNDETSYTVIMRYL